MRNASDAIFLYLFPSDVPRHFESAHSMLVPQNNLLYSFFSLFSLFVLKTGPGLAPPTGSSAIKQACVRIETSDRPSRQHLEKNDDSLIEILLIVQEPFLRQRYSDSREHGPDPVSR